MATLHGDLATELLGLLAHDGEAESATGDLGDDGAGREIGLEDQLQRARIVDFFRGLCAQHATLGGSGLEPRHVDAGTIIGEFDAHVAAVHRCHCELDGGARRLAGLLASLRSFNAMVDGVAQQVHQRILHLLEDAPVDFDLAAQQREFHVLALIARQIAHQFREQAADRGHWQHQQLLGIGQQLVDELAHRGLVALGGMPERTDLALQRAQVVMVPLEEFTQRRMRALQAQRARLRLHLAPFLAPGFELHGEGAKFGRALRSGELGGEHFFRFEQACIELVDGDAYGFMATGFVGCCCGW